MDRRFAIGIFLVLLLAGCRSPSNQSGALIDLSHPPRLFAQNHATDTQNRGMFAWGANQNGPQIASQQNEAFNSLAEQVQSLNQRLGQFDSDNQLLLTEIAGLKQKLQAAGDYNYQLKQQLSGTIAQLQQLENEKRNLEQQLASANLRGNQVSGPVAVGSGGSMPTQLTGGATLRANNSLLQKLPQIQLTGVTTRMDGDVIRLEIGSDQLFVPGTYQINPTYGQLLQDVVRAIDRDFARQIVGIEAHWDGTPLQPATATDHQLTASQALAVFDYLSRAGLPSRQMFTMSMGSNRPRHSGVSSNGINPNRRIEIVIYPETYDGR